MADISCRELTKIYGDGTVAVKDLSIEIRDGEIAVLVGPSGCGKTTLLRMIAGLERVTSGSINLGARVVTHLSPKQRDVAMVFQNYALYPHMSAYDNMAYALKIRREGKEAIRAKVLAAGRTLGLSDVLHKKPRHLSGGQRQRVAMGRAIVRDPQAFLMDEPLSNLDAKLRVQMRGEIRRLQRSLGVTTAYVTHDQAEALTLGDVIAVMRNGVLQQFDTPEHLYDRPASVFVAGFIGSPAMNMMKARVERSDGIVVRLGENAIRLGAEMAEARPFLGRMVGQEVIIGIRPEHIQDAGLTGHDPGRPVVAGRVDLRESLGSEIQLSFGIDAQVISPDEVPAGDVGSDETGGGEGDHPPAVSRLLVARVDSRSMAREGEVFRGAIDPHRLYFFDPRSGKALSDSGAEATAWSATQRIDASR